MGGELDAQAFSGVTQRLVEVTVGERSDRSGLLVDEVVMVGVVVGDLVAGDSVASVPAVQQAERAQLP